MHSKKVRLADGSACDYQAIFMEFYNSLVLYADRYMGVREESMSIVQDVFLSMWEIDRVFDDEPALVKYIYAATRNRALNVIRKKTAAGNYRKSMADQLDDRSDRLFFVEEETFRLLMHEIAKLPEHQREVVLMALDNLNNNQIAQTLNISVNTVKFHKKNAYKILRDKLADDYFLSFLL